MKNSNPMQMTSARPRLDGIESLRAVAAVAIILYHMVLLPNPNIVLPDYLSIVKERFGLGVPLFYTLSGFVLAYGYMGKLTDQASIFKFYVKRFFRIAPLFYLMIFVWMFASYIKWGIFPANLHDLVLNFFFLFGFVPGKHESIVWAGWSIGVEMIFYLFFPLVTMLISGFWSALLVLLIAILVSSSFFASMSAMNAGSYAYMSVVTQLPFFLSGILGFIIWERTSFSQNKTVGLLTLIVTILLTIAVVGLPAVNDLLRVARGVNLDLYVWAIIFMLLILSIALWPNKMMVNPLTRYMGRVSFSMYLWHPLIIIILVDAYSAIGTIYGAGMRNFILCSFVTLSAVGLMALVSFRLVEQPGMNFGKKVASRV